MKLKLAFDEECYAKKTTNQEIWLILAIIVIIVVVIAVIVILGVLFRPKKSKSKTTSKSAITQSTEKSFRQYPKGSITEDIDRYHNRFLDSKTETTVDSKTSDVNERLNSITKGSGNTSDMKSN